MIPEQFFGKEVSMLLREPTLRRAFDASFDDECYFGARYPSLVLGAVRRVPPSPSEGWHVGFHDCGGFGCDWTHAAFIPLRIREDMLDFLEFIADEKFTQHGLDYYWAPNPEQHSLCVLPDYQEALKTRGLSWSPEKSPDTHLTQALYPIDATPENLKLLSPDAVDLESLGASSQDLGLVIWVVGENCD